MKQIIKLFYLTVIALLLSSTLSAQSHDQNYVLTTDYKIETQTDINIPIEDKLESITYIDGIARPKQTVLRQAGGNLQDIISPIIYDEFGRVLKNYLPYTNLNQASGTSSLDYINNSNIIDLTNSYYLSKFPEDIDEGNPNPYSEKIYENSLRSRLQKQAANGNSWINSNGNDRTLKFEYHTNITDEVKQFSITHANGNKTNTELVYDGSFIPNQLFKTVVKNENWQSSQNYEKDYTTDAFKDKLGRVILNRAYNGNQNHDTYYVYDDYGNLTYVIPPKASDEIVIEGDQGFIVNPLNYPWTKFIEVDKSFAEDYERQLADYENEDILNIDLENEYGAQGGFTISTINAGELLFSINLSSTIPVILKTGEIISLKEFGTFKDSELGITSDGNYIFTINNNAIWINYTQRKTNSEIKYTSLNHTFSNTTKLNYDENYSWAEISDISKDEANQYLSTIKQQNISNSELLEVVIENSYGAQGGLNVSIDENDFVTFTVNINAITPISLKKGIVASLNTKRRLPNKTLGEIGGYTFSIKDNSIYSEGSTIFTSLSGTLISSPNPPTYSTSTETVEGLCYIYHYDNKNRLVEKKIPGKDWEYIIYDTLNRPVLTQDARLRQNNQWLFTKYDPFGRVVYTGMYSATESLSRVTLQNTITNGINDGIYSINEQKSISAITLPSDASTEVFYTNTTFPNSGDIELYTINYYDDYNINLSSDFDYQDSYSQSLSTNTKSLNLINKVRILGVDKWSTSVIYYDDKSKPIYVVSKNNYLNTLDKIKTKFDFVGNVLETSTEHQKENQNNINSEDFYTYDHSNRLLTQTQSINGSVSELIVNNHYDELGQLNRKNVGGQVASNVENSNGLQTVDYTYNIRGWLKQINDIETLGNDLFSFKINYNTTDLDNTPPLYNGNISETHWKTANDDIQRSYYYKYDALNRIKQALYSNDYQGDIALTNEEDYSLGGLSYDKNGNIQSLKRVGRYHSSPDYTGIEQYDLIDILSYLYEPLSNKLIAVSDDATNNFGFKDYNTSSEDYQYDINGNLIRDANKGITLIRYNHLNLPTSVSIQNSATQQVDEIEYVYDATGVKMEKQVNNYQGVGIGIEKTLYAGNYIYTQLAFEGSSSWENPPELKFFSQPEGYIEPNSNDGTYNYIYQYKDHLGNIRLSYKTPNNYQSFINSAFYDDVEGWEMYGGSMDNNTEIEEGRLKVNVKHAWSGPYFIIGNSFNAGDEIEVDIDIDKGTTDKMRFYFQELDENGQHLQYFTQDSNLQTGSHHFTHTVVHEGASVKVKVDKSNTNIGVETFFYIDNVFANFGDLEIVEESNYYPFGLKHKGYNNYISPNTNGVASKYKTYQSQEYHDELELNIHEWKYRWSDPSIGRFMQIDPLAEDYVYNGVYNFAENRIIDGFELEGLEWFPINGDGIARAFETVANRVSEALGLDRMTFILEGNAKVNLGLAVGVRIKEASLLDINGSINAFSFEVASAKADFTDPFNPNSYDGELGFDENDNMTFTQGAGLSVKEKLFGKFGFGGQLSRKADANKIFGVDYRNAENTSDFYLFGEIYSGTAKNKEFFENKASPKSKAKVKIAKDKTCFCIDFGIGFQVILGLDLNLKIGVEYEHE